MKMLRVFSILLIFTFLFSCNSKKEMLPGWIIGTWQINDGSNYETWVKLNDSEYFGKSYSLRNEDTIVNETIQLIQKNELIYYVPTVVNQNDGKPIEFKLVEKEDVKLVFENKLHDFPKQIIYNLKDQKSIMVTVQGPAMDGSNRSIDFQLKKIN